MFPRNNKEQRKKKYNTCNHPYIIRIKCNLQNTGNKGKVEF